MHLSKYQDKSMKTAQGIVLNGLNALEKANGNPCQAWFNPQFRNAIQYCCIKLAGETGEICEPIGKALRGDHTLTDIHTDLTEELGDILWYVSGLATLLNVGLSTIATANIAKLAQRYGDHHNDVDDSEQLSLPLVQDGE